MKNKRLVECFCLSTLLIMMLTVFAVAPSLTIHAQSTHISNGVQNQSGGSNDQIRELSLTGNSTRSFDNDEDSIGSISSLFTIDRRLGNADYHAGMRWYSNQTDVAYYLFVRPGEIALAKEESPPTKPHVELTDAPIDFSLDGLINLTALFTDGKLTAVVNGEPVLIAQNMSGEAINSIGFRTHNAEASLRSITASPDVMTKECNLPIPFCLFMG